MNHATGERVSSDKFPKTLVIFGALPNETVVFQTTDSDKSTSIEEDRVPFPARGQGRRGIVRLQRVCLLVGGSVLFIESGFINPVEALDASQSSSKDEKNNAMSGSLTLTGKLGDVMKESCKIALTFAKSYMQQKHQENRSLRVGHIHVHVPEVSGVSSRCSPIRDVPMHIGCHAQRWSLSRLYDRHGTSFTRLE